MEPLKEKIENLRKHGFKYITRAQHGEVVAHKKEPVRQINFWESDNRRVSILEADLFSFLEWQDESLYIGG